MTDRRPAPWLTTAAICAAAGLALGGCTGDSPRPGGALSTKLTAAPVPAPGAADQVLRGEPLAADPFTRPQRRPNILMITADDASASDIRRMPNVQRLLVEQGATLKGFAPTPICVPARASLVTGQYAHNHGALTIDGKGGGFKSFEDAGTLPVWLQAAGYDTFFVGKYLNGYGETRGRTYVPPGWTSWNGTVDPSTYDFFHPTVNHNGDLQTYKEYNSDLFGRISTDFIEQPRRTRKPWFMWANYVAPHVGAPTESDDPRVQFPDDPEALGSTVPAPRDRDKLEHVELPNKPSMFEKDTSDKSSVKSVQQRWTKARKAQLREVYTQRLESLIGVDRAVGQTLRALRRTHQLANTLVVFSSDNGYMVGEHNMAGKLWPYHESVSIPMVIRGPGVPKGTDVPMPVTNLDLATTFAALADAKPQRPQDGINIMPWLTRNDARTRVIPIEAYPVHGGRRALYRGIVTGHWTFIRFRSGKEELYSTRLDPYQLSNLAYDTRFTAQRLTLRGLMEQYRSCAGATCPKDVWR